MIVKLSKPIMHGETAITELNLREPTVEDVAELGYPFVLITNDNETAVQLQPKVILKYAAKLSGVPPSIIKNITLTDLSNLQGEIMGFFGQEAEAPPK